MAATLTQVKALREPTPKDEVKQRAGPGGMKLSYVDARYHFDRYDDCVGPGNWQTQFERDIKGNLRAGVGILIDFEDGRDPQWVWKWDTGTPSTMEPEKGEHSDAIKRAGVQWGVSRDLYDASPERSPALRRPTTPSAGSAGTPVSLASSGWKCPVHGGVKVVPAGVSKRTGRSYPAFEVCGEMGCDQKPGRGSRKPQPVFVAPDPTEWVGMAPEDDDDGHPFAFGDLSVGDIQDTE